MLKIYFENRIIEDCTSAIIIPEKAVDEAGYIQTMTVRNDASAKHEFHAMAQTAYFQFQDHELEIQETTDEIRIVKDDQEEKLSKAMIIYRDTAGAFHVFLHSGLSPKKMLETAYRFCTRWVRLDI